jgi:DNA-binding winged helix-turn-helix (wHTH) protein
VVAVGLKRIDLRGELPEVAWTWQGLIPRGFVSMVGALPGEGKTVLLTALAWQATRPQGELLGREVAHGPVVYLDFDAPTGDGRATRRWLEAHARAFPDGDMDLITLLEPDGETYGLGEKEYEELTALAQERKPVLIVVDSFMAAWPVDPVKLHLVQGPMWYLRRLAQESGAALVVIDHLPKPTAQERAGARGLLGSVAKTAQARAVHILTRVAPKEVGGRHVLKWECVKNSFAPLPEPFGVELVFEGGVRVEETALPEGTGNPKRDKARLAILELLNARAGEVVPKAELVQAAVVAANVHKKTAERYLAELAQEVGLEVAALPGQGGPVGYRLPHTHDSKTPKPQEGPSPSQKVLEHPPAPKPSPAPKPRQVEGGEQGLKEEGGKTWWRL